MKALQVAGIAVIPDAAGMSRAILGSLIALSMIPRFIKPEYTHFVPEFEALCDVRARHISVVSAIKAFSKDRLRASNYFDLNIVDPLKRVPGVSTVTVLGERKYAMRLWVDPKRLAFNRLSVDDVSPQWK